MTHNKIKNKYNLTSKFYDILDYSFEASRCKKKREKIWILGSGRILDAGMGTGRNIPFYLKNSDLYGARFDRKTIEYVKKENFKILENLYVHQDTIRMIVLQP